MKEKETKKSREEKALNDLKKERESLHKELQVNIKEVYALSAQARYSKKKEDFDAYVKASARYESNYNRLVKLELELKEKALKVNKVLN